MIRKATADGAQRTRARARLGATAALMLVPLLAAPWLEAQWRERPPRRSSRSNATAEALRATGPLRDCRRAAADATGAPWGVENSAQRCERARQQEPEISPEFRESSGSCWDALGRAIAEMRIANRLYEQSRRVGGEEQRRLNAEARRHHRAANAAIDEADACITRVAELVAQILSELHGGGRGGRERPRTRPQERPTPTPRPAPWGLPPAEAAEDPCQDHRLGLRQIPAGGVDRLDGGFFAGPEQPQQLQSNHPELLTRLPVSGAITVSTLAPRGKLHPEAHLEHSFAGPFRVLVSHQNATGATAWQTLALHNPGPTPVRVTVNALASTDTDEAPYYDLGGRSFPPLALNPGARTANGPGDRTATRVLTGEVEGGVRVVTVRPGRTLVLHSARHAAGKELVTQAELDADGFIQAAVVYTRTLPTVSDVERVLQESALVPRNPGDRPPTPPGAPGPLVYGRVAGVVERSTFAAAITNDREHRRFIAVPGCERRYAFNTKRGGPNVDLGTGVDQAGPLARGADGRALRYPDAAYANNGNYGAEFIVRLELVNPGPRAVTAHVCLDTPASIGGGVSFALRNTLEVGPEGGRSDYWYAHEAVGTSSPDPCIAERLAPGETRHVRLRLFYAANNTSPQVLRVKTD